MDMFKRLLYGRVMVQEKSQGKAKKKKKKNQAGKGLYHSFNIGVLNMNQYTGPWRSKMDDTFL